MKDLKYIHFFEELLERTDNELVRIAKADGGVAAGYTCYYVPEVLLNSGKAFSVRLRAPGTNALIISQYYMSSFVCGYAKALIERAFEGGFDFIDFYASSDTCQQMVRVVENIHELEIIKNPRFSYGIIDAPLKVSGHGTKLYIEQIRKHFIKPLEEQFGVDFSDDALREAVREHNEMCSVFEEISEMRKSLNPVITPSEFHILCLVSYSCPTALILPYLKETLEELKTREPDRTSPWRARVIAVGSELDSPEFSRILENCGCYVAADRYCFGSIPGRQPIPVNDTQPMVDQICRFYLETNQCPRFMSDEKIRERREVVKKLADDYHADGIIYEQAKFCDFWGYERMLAVEVMNNEYGIPAMGIDREYSSMGQGQLSTRVQAFIEQLELRKAHGDKKQ